MKQIAELAGVSTATVSRALSKPDVVDARTRKRILDLAERLQYRPNHLVHGVIQGKIKQVALVVGNSGAEATSRLIRVIQERLFANGYSILVYNTDQDIEREVQCLRDAVSYRVSGLIVSTVNYSAGEQHFWKLREHGTPFVLLSSYGESVSAPHVHLDNEGIARQVLDYLVDELGHRDLLILAGPERTWGSSLFGEWGRLMAERGVEDASGRYVATLWDIDSGYEAMRSVLESGRRPTAIVGITDDVAAGAMRAIREAGLRVPEDISVLGFGNSRIGNVLSPRLSTVDTGYVEVANKCTELLLEMMKSGKASATALREMGLHHVVAGSIVPRESVRGVRD